MIAAAALLVCILRAACVPASANDDDPHAILVFDERRVSRAVLSVGPREFSWLQFLDGRNSLRDVQSATMRRSGGALTPIEPFVCRETLATPTFGH